jgi:RHS repeat-associated protein
MGNYTVYVNPYLVLNSGGYSKHYYIESQRIVSKLGGGWDNNGQGSLKAGNGKVDYVGRQQKVFDGIVKNLKFLGADGQILTAGKSGKVPPGQVNGTGNIAEVFRYFFHPDHLGSTNYVTDASGEVFQHLEYMAFGETFVDEHSNTDRTPYLFNGKELDEETGLYYYGARYYDPRTSVWASLDPLAEKYPEWSPYNYSFNNPLRFIDPDGRGPDDEITANDKEMAMLASDVYQTRNGKYVEGAEKSDLGGWKLSEKDFGITLTDDKSGFNSAVYEKEVNGEMKYAYVTQGSDFDNGGNDWSENYKQSMGQYSAQYDQSVKNAIELKKALGDNLSFAGHSLGGGLASANALATGLDATTFNAAGISNGSRSLYGLDKTANIKAFVVHGEIVSVTQGVLGLRAEGHIHKLPATYIPFIPFAPPQVRVATAVINLGLSAYNHTMGSVMSKMGIK